MPESEPKTFCQDRSKALLLAIVSVAHAERIRCGQPACGHSVFRRIHVVREDGKVLVLGSTCFAKRYGAATALGAARFGGGDGRALTDEECQLLLNNTEALITLFEEESAAIKAAYISPAISSLRPSSAKVSTLQAVPHQHQQETPWAWVKPLSSVIYLMLKDGSGWMRAQRKDGQHLVLPWPVFDGWDEALPPLFGLVDGESGGNVLPDVVAALKYLRDRAEWETKPGRWKDVLAEIARRPSGPGQIKGALVSGLGQAL